MATKWSTPGVVFREVDNTVRANADPGNGRGAIVLNANKGYPNQRVLNTSLDDFYKMYGEPDNVNQYGHFAAANFFGAGSEQLLTVRATMGDEGYAQVQYPYTDASTIDTKNVSGMETFQFVDNELTDNLKLIENITSANWDALKEAGYEGFPEKKEGEYDYDSLSCFALSASADRAILKDVRDEFEGDDSYSVTVYRNDSNGASAACIETVSGKYYRMLNNSAQNKYVDFSVLGAVTGADASAYSADNFDETGLTFNIASSAADKDYCNVDLFIPNNSAVDGQGGWVSNIGIAVSAVSGTTVKFTDIVNSANLEIAQTSEYADTVAAAKTAKDDTILPILLDKDENVGVEVSYVKVCDWDDLETKSYLVRTQDTKFGGLDNLYKASHSGCVGIEYKEYGMADYNNDLAIAGSVSAYKCEDFKADKADGPEDENSKKYSELVAIAEEYGLDASEITNGKYAVLYYNPAKTWTKENKEQAVKLVKIDSEHAVNEDHSYTGISEALFAAYQETKDTKITQKSIIKFIPAKAIVKPWQIDDGTNVSRMTAISTTEVMADSTGTYADGYTPSCETDDEPGNGDIEQFESNQENQLVIAAVGPGEWGNDIGVSVITAEAAKYPCLSHANAFSWKYRYDDEDKVDGAEEPDNYEKNDENLTWKKVYRINVYVKAKEKTAKVWGTGLDALTSDPIESWYVSNDPLAKDSEGNTLYAPYVINGHSNYIYVSKKSVAAATNYKGEISQPRMTWSIYQLQGGTNSKLNNIKEKTAALKLYEDRSKADFDILFNVEGIDTFNGRQRYSAHQRRIGEIAAARGMDIGVIQATSREAKTIKLELSEAKTFSFNNGSYVAAYAGYDRYYDSYTANWIYLPKSVAGACAMCYCDVYSYPWMAPAGLARGQIAYSNKSNIRLNDTEIGQLYDNNINTSKNCVSYGEVLWGQKTMLKKESALNRINVRRLLNYIEKNLETMLVPYLYQQNTVNTRTSMKTTVDAFLSRIQSAEGILSKKVSVTTDPDDSHIVYVTLNIVPAESIEWICVTLVLDRNTGVVATES